MKSVLLGGLKVFLINDGGFPLSAPGGRAKFFKAGTSTPETVYSDIDLTEGTALGPVVYTDSLGALPAIWLKTDRLYKVVVEQKVSDDPEVWAVLWEVDNVGTYVQESPEVTGDPSAVVSSISALKAVDHGEHSTVQVLGYYTPGDWGEPSTFVYDPESTASEDGGAVIRPNDNSGRWFQQLGSVIDVRKFGAIPDIVDNSDVTSRVQAAATYAANNTMTDRSRPPVVAFVAPGKYVLAGGFDFTVYSFTDISDSSVHPLNWYIGEGVVFVTSSAAITLSKFTDCRTVEALVEGASALNVEPGGRIEVDPVWWGSLTCDLVDCIVKCSSVTTNTKVFDNCSIESVSKLDGDVTLANMDFKQSWFVDDYDWTDLSISSVLINLQDCRSGNDYIDIVNAMVDKSAMPPAYGDMRHVAISGKTLKDGFAISNAVFDSVVVAGEGIIESCSGSITKDSSNVNSLTIRSSTLTIKPNSSHEFDYVALLIVYGSVITGESSYTKVVCNGCRCFDSTIDVRMKVSGRADFKSCGINYDVEHHSVENAGTWSIDGTMTDCILSASHVLLTADTGSNTVVNFLWKGNASSAVVAVDVSGISSHVKSAQYHSYEYEGNGGTFLPTAKDDYFPITSNIGFSTIPDIPSTTGDKAYIVYTDASSPNASWGAYLELGETYNFFSLGFVEQYAVEVFADFVLQELVSMPKNPDFMDYEAAYRRIRSTSDGSVDLSNISGFYTNFILSGDISQAYSVSGVSVHVSVRKVR